MRNRRRDIVGSLPQETVENHLVDKLPLVDIHQCQFVSSKWQNLFSNFGKQTWKKLIARDFRISFEILLQFENELHLPKFVLPNYQLIYQRLHRVYARGKSFDQYYQNKLKQPQNYFNLLICCLNNATLAEKILPREADEIWIKTSFSADCDNIYKMLLARNKTRWPWFTMSAVEANNLEALKYLLSDEKIVESISPYSLALERTESLGLLHIYQYLKQVICRRSEYSFNMYQESKRYDICQRVANSGNIEFFKFLEFKKETIECHGVSLGHSGNLALFHYMNQIGYLNVINERMFSGAIYSGNLALVKFLQQFNPPFDLSMLNSAVSSQNVHLVDYLCQYYQKKPTKGMMDLAAKAGDLVMVKFLLDPANQFSLLPTKNTLLWACYSGNLELIQYLLNPANHFRLNLKSCRIDHIFSSGDLNVMHFLMQNGPISAPYDITCRPTIYDAIKDDHIDMLQFILNPFNNIIFRKFRAGDGGCGVSLTMKKLVECEVHITIAFPFNNQSISRLQEAFALHFSHYVTRIIYILSHPDKYGLTDSIKDLLTNHFIKMITSRELVPYEKETLTKLMPYAPHELQDRQDIKPYTARH